MAEEIQLDAVDVVVPADFLDVAEGQVANLGPAVIDRAPGAVGRAFDRLAHQPLRMLLFERREEQVRLLRRICRIVRVVHAHRPEGLHPLPPGEAITACRQSQPWRIRSSEMFRRLASRP